MSDKRRKLQTGPSSLVRKSRIFSPFRTIGQITDPKPFAIGTLGQTFYIATIVGKSFQIYDAATLHLLFVSTTQASTPITAIQAHFQYVFCSYSNKIGIFRRGKLETELEIPEDAGIIIKIVAFGNYLIAATDSCLFVFEKRTAKDKYATQFYTSIPINSTYGTVIDICHMATYMNKIVIATSSVLLLINVKTTKVIFATKKDLLHDITCIQPAPALDIIAVGDHNGYIYIYNLRKDRILQKISSGTKSSITSISFRTDDVPHLVCSLRSGDLFFYDLSRKARVHLLRNAHREANGGAIKASFLNGQPVIVSAGADNSLKEFVFDPVLSTTDSSVVSPPRHLRSRGGHSSPPCCLLFADHDSHFISSASTDRSFWVFSLRKDSQSQEMSQKQSKMKNGKRVAGVISKYKGKFPPIVMMAQENAREGEWDNIVTAHQDETFARTWSSKNRKVGKFQLDTIDGGICKTVAITQCGNFALIGSSKGGIGVYNLQSGKLRKLYRLHKKAVTGIAVDGMNRKMVSCGIDGIVGFYDFAMSKYLGKINLGVPITRLAYHRGSDLVALALDDMTIVIIDASTQRIVRRLYGHRNRITAMDFMPDGRWLVSASLDSTIRTWDLPTGSCIDGINLPDVATCLKISPQGEFMATAHVNSVGIALWTNKAQFHPVSTRDIEDESEFANILMPNVSGEGGESIIEGAFTKDDNKDEITGQYISPDHLESLVTLSHCSTSKFNTLLHLDTIKERNKPKDPENKPKSLPFFMQLSADTLGTKKTDDIKQEEVKPSAEPNSRLLNLKDEDKTNVAFESQFTKLLRISGNCGDYQPFIDYLVDMTPASTDLEIRSISFNSPYTEVISFLNGIKYGLVQRTNFELLTAISSMFLKVHGDSLFEIRRKSLVDKDAEKVVDASHELHTVSSNRAVHMDELTKYCSEVLTFITSS